ncbi:MAG: hypothetical protein PHE79_08960 [Eubacteriales bacterium]|nr:hypothetical protein [Eubacteriales bacterium]
MDIINTIDFGLEAKAWHGAEYIEIESVRFDKASKKKINDILQTRSPNAGNMVLNISCLFTDLDNFKKMKPLGRYSGEFFPDISVPFKLRNFDLCFNPAKVEHYDGCIEISDVSMIIYSV